MAEREKLSNMDLISKLKWSQEDFASYRRVLWLHKQRQQQIIDELDDPSIIGEERKDLERNLEWNTEAIRGFKSYISFYADEVQRCEQLLKDRVTAIMHCVVNRKEKKILIVGGEGVGKTHVEALMLKMEPLIFRISTPCAKVSPWLLRNLLVKSGPSSIKLLTEKTYRKMMLTAGRDAFSKSESTDSQQIENSNFSDADEQFLNMFQETLEDESLENKIFGRIIDINGQPQLLELLPHFISGMSHGIVVIDLSQQLNKHPICYFYGEDGKPVGKGIQSKLTNEQIVRMFLQMILSQSTDSKMVHIVIVGTHRDLEFKCLESRSKKESKLQEIIKSFGLQHNVVYTDETHSSVIFPVNALHPKKEDHMITQKIMELAMEENNATDVNIPLKYHNLELTLKMLTESKKMALPLEQVFVHVSHYFSDLIEMKEGLIFLHNSFLIFYFIEIPDLVFGEPQLLLNFMTAVTVHHIKLTTNPSQNETSTGIWKQFKEQGIITEDILVSIANVFDDILTPRIMIEVMQKLLIICKVKEGEYLMPSLLTTLASLPTSKPSPLLQWLPFDLRKYFSSLLAGMSSDITMLVHFPNGHIPFGVYCSTVCDLNSRFHWELKGEVYRNKISFTLPQSPGVVTFIDSFNSFLVVNLEIASDFSTGTISSLCEEIRKTIFSAIKKVMKDLMYAVNNPVMAFLCDHDKKYPHVAEYLEKYHCLQCIQDETINKSINEKHQLWLDCANEEAGNLPSASAFPTPSSTRDVAASFEDYVDQILETSRFKLQHPIESDQHICKLAEKLVGWETKHYLFGFDYDPDVHDILCGQNRDRCELQRIEVLHKWKRKTLDPTYGALLHVLVDGGFLDSAALMISILNEELEK